MHICVAIYAYMCSYICVAIILYVAEIKGCEIYTFRFNSSTPDNLRILYKTEINVQFYILHACTYVYLL